MSSITQIQNQQINSVANQANKKAPPEGDEKQTTIQNDSSEPLLNKMSQQLNANEKRESVEISEHQTQNLIPDTATGMMGAQSGNITAEFVANLLNKNPYEK